MSIRGKFRFLKRKIMPYTVLFGTINIAIFLLWELISEFIDHITNPTEATCHIEIFLSNNQCIEHYIVAPIIFVVLVFLIHIIYKRIKKHNLAETSSLDDFNI